MNNEKVEPAFPSQPVSPHGEPWSPEYGMTLRDYFAASNLVPEKTFMWIEEADDQELLERYGTEEEIERGFEFSVPHTPIKMKSIDLRHRLEACARAEMRYREADAMLKERKNEDNK